MKKLILILEKSPELPRNHHVHQNTDSMRSQDMSKNLAMTPFVCPTSPLEYPNMCQKSSPCVFTISPGVHHVLPVMHIMPVMPVLPVLNTW